MYAKKTKQLKYNFFYLYIIFYARILFVQRFFFFEIPKRYENLLKLLPLFIYIIAVVFVCVCGKYWTEFMHFPNCLFFIQFVLLAFFYNNTKKNEMYSSEMDGFSPFWRKLLAPFRKRGGEPSIHTKTKPSKNENNKKKFHRVMKGSYEVLFSRLYSGWV